MEKTLKVLWGVACLVGMVCALWLVFRPTPVVVVGSNGEVEQTAQTFGGTTGLDSLALQGNLSVAGTTSLTGAASFTGDISTSGALSVAGTSTFSGEVSGVTKLLSQSMSSSATTTACTFLNSSGVTRVIYDMAVVDRGSATSLGVVSWVAGTSTLNGANGSSAPVYTKGINTIVTRVSGADALTTTSTILGTSGALYQWNSGEYFNFVSGSTTNTGTCRLTYM